MILKILPVTAFVENVYILASEETKEAVVFDPGGEADRINALIDEMGVTVKYILNTHGHMDHVGGVAKVREATDARFGIHEIDVEMMRRQPADYAFRLIPDFVEPPEPDLLVKDGDEFQIGELCIKAIETPGHTMGSTCYLVDSLLISGDTLFPGGPGKSRSPEAFVQLLNSITTKLLTLSDDTAVYPGHGDDTTIGEARRRHADFSSRSHPADMSGDVDWLTS